MDRDELIDISSDDEEVVAAEAAAAAAAANKIVMRRGKGPFLLRLLCCQFIHCSFTYAICIACRSQDNWQCLF
jgi:hypothetical protein